MQQSSPRRFGEPPGSAAIGVLVGAVLSVLQGEGKYNLGATLVGLLLLAVLIGFGAWPQRADTNTAIAYCAALAFCLLFIASPLLDPLFNLSAKESSAYLVGWRTLVTWLVLFALCFIYWRTGRRPPWASAAARTP
jgi:hypothetical protein